MTLSNQQFILVGEAANYLALALNAAATSSAMLGLPSPSAYDSGWASHGFCVVEGSVPTELLAAFPLIASAVAIHFFARSKEAELKDSPLLGARIRATIFGNAAHGLGHAFLWATGEATPPLELSLEPAAVAYSLMLMGFWVGALRAVLGVPSGLASKMAFAVLVAQYLLAVPPELTFTYSQSVILFAESLNMLMHKKEYSKDGFLYFATSLRLLPLFTLFYFETKCTQSFLAHLGGHALYDLYLSLVPFALYYAVTGMKQKRI